LATPLTSTQPSQCCCNGWEKLKQQPASFVKRLETSQNDNQTINLVHDPLVYQILSEALTSLSNKLDKLQSDLDECNDKLDGLDVAVGDVDATCDLILAAVTV